MICSSGVLNALVFFCFPYFSTRRTHGQPQMRNHAIAIFHPHLKWGILWTGWIPMKRKVSWTLILSYFFFLSTPSDSLPICVLFSFVVFYSFFLCLPVCVDFPKFPWGKYPRWYSWNASSFYLLAYIYFDFFFLLFFFSFVDRYTHTHARARALFHLLIACLYRLFISICFLAFPESFPVPFVVCNCLSFAFYSLFLFLFIFLFPFPFLSIIL